MSFHCAKTRSSPTHTCASQRKSELVCWVVRKREIECATLDVVIQHIEKPRPFDMLHIYSTVSVTSVHRQRKWSSLPNFFHRNECSQTLTYSYLLLNSGVKKLGTSCPTCFHTVFPAARSVIAFYVDVRRSYVIVPLLLGKFVSSYYI